MTFPSLYNLTDRSVNISVVDGTTTSGLQATDGSYYVVLSPGTGAFVGTHHYSGAWYVTVAPSNNYSLYAPDGSYYVSETPFSNRGIFVTVVSGTLHPIIGGSHPTYFILGF